MRKHICMSVILVAGLLFHAGCATERANAVKTGQGTPSVAENPIPAGTGTTHTAQSQSAPDRPAPTPSEQQPALRSPAFSGEAGSKAEGPIPGPSVSEAERGAEGSQTGCTEPNATTDDSGRSDTAVQANVSESRQGWLTPCNLAPMVEPNLPKPAEPNETPPVQQIAPEQLITATAQPNAEVEEPNTTERAQTQAAPTFAPEANEPNPVRDGLRQTSSATLFHDKCADILRSFVKEDGMVDYSSLRRRRLELKQLLAEFGNLDPNQYNGWSREDKVALWINAYNIQMLNIITDNYPIRASRILTLIWGPYSIRHIKGIWTDHKLMVMDEEFTLAEIEKRFFSGRFDDPRLYLAVTYSNLSSPPLRNEPYYGHKLNQQLEDEVRRFLNSGYCLRIDRNRKTVYLSALFQPTWRGKEFVARFGTDKKFKDQVPETRAVLNFISNYIPQEDISFLELENYSVEYMKYDWTVNDISQRP